MALKRVCVFAGSTPGARPEYAQAAVGLGELLAARGIGVVDGGSNIGLMGAVADAALAAGGEVIGVIPEQLVSREVAHRGLTELRVVPTMHARKALMSDLADAFVALPGGIGTIEELVEMLTWNKLGIHRKPCGALDAEGYWGPLLALLEGAAAAEFMTAAELALLSVDHAAAPLLDTLAARATGRAD